MNPSHRRRFLKRSAALAAAALGAPGLALLGEEPRAAGGPEAPKELKEPKEPKDRDGQKAPVSPKTRPDVIVHRGGYPGWPWVARAGKESLVCVFRDDGIHGFSPSGKVLFTASADDGKTWTPARAIADEPGVDDRNAAIERMPDGRLLVCYNTYTKDEVSRCKLISSADGGTTWTAPSLLADLDMRTRAAPLALASGEILIPIYKAPGNGAVAALSADGAKTWTLHRVPDVPGFLGDEWTVLEVERGRLVGILRNSGAVDGYFWKTESGDGGRTWKDPVKTNVRDARSTSPAHLEWHGKTPVLTYSDLRMVSVSMVTTRDPEYRTWDLEGRVPCYLYESDGAPISDASYPVSVQVGEHRRFIVDYEIRKEGHWIAGYFVDLPEGWR